jgi:hypothetical protein
VRRGIWITVLAVLAFAVIVIARLPATWVIPDSSGAFSCAAIDGSIWSGTCTGLTAQGSSYGDVTWSVHALRLLTGKLSANVALTRATGSLQGDFDVGFDKAVTARNVQAAFPLQDELMKALLPQNLRTLQGNASANIASARIANNIVKEIQGRLEVHDLEDHDRGEVTPLGSYQLTFPGGSGDPVGQLHDLGGPLGIDGTVRIKQDQPGVELHAYITLRPGAPHALVDQLQVLAPDAQGRREFGTEMTF